MTDSNSSSDDAPVADDSSTEEKASDEGAETANNDEDEDEDGEDDGDRSSDDAKSKSKSADEESGKKKTVSNIVFAVGFLVTLGVGYVAGQYLRDAFGEQPEIVQGERFAVELRGDEPQMGPDDALVTIVEFSDFECPYCAKATEPLEKVVEDYDGKVRLIFKNYPLPFHRKALPAAYAGYAANKQGHFWEVHDHLFATKGSIAGIPELVKELGMDNQQFGKDMESDEAKKYVDGDYLAGGRAGIRSTPSFLVNGHPYSGARDERFWRAVIDAEIDAAEDLGVPAAEVYATLMKAAKQERGGGAAPGGAPSERKAAKRRPGEPYADKSYDIPTGDRPQQGPDDALVTIVEFSDYHCPFCARAHATIETVREKYPNEVRVVHRQRPLPIHRNAKDAARVALAAHRQGKFDEVHAKLFSIKGADMAQMKRAAVELGLDAEKLDADLDDPSIDQTIDEDRALADHFGARGTPAFFINGRFINGAQAFATFDSLIQEEKAKAEALVESGTPRGDVYSALMDKAEKEVAD